MESGQSTEARAQRLIAAFCSPVESFASLRAVSPAEIPEPYRCLLDHRSHMTVAMERFCGGPVGLEIIAEVRPEHADRIGRGKPAGDRGWYAREILLTDSLGLRVQHGIVEIDLDCVDAGTAGAILAGLQPLGRILIAANLLRDVHDVGLLELVAGPRLRSVFRCERDGAALRTFGRVAQISLDGRPAVNLLEIAAPGFLPKPLR